MCSIGLGNKNTSYLYVRKLFQGVAVRIIGEAALECFTEVYRINKNPIFDISIHRRRASNSFREALLLRWYRDDGAKAYKECRKFSENDKVVEIEFQMPSKVFHSLFGSSEELPGDQVIWSGLPVNYHVLSIFQTLFWTVTPWCNTHTV